MQIDNAFILEYDVEKFFIVVHADEFDSDLIIPIEIISTEINKTIKEVEKVLISMKAVFNPLNLKNYYFLNEDDANAALIMLKLMRSK